MNTTSKILLTVGVVSVVGVGYYLLTKNKPLVTQDQLAGLNANTVSKIDEPLDTPANTIVPEIRSVPRPTVTTRDLITGAVISQTEGSAPTRVNAVTTSTGTRGTTLSSYNVSTGCTGGRRC